MIQLKVEFSKKHINIYLKKDLFNLLSISTKNNKLKKNLFRTNNTSAILNISSILIKELKFAGISEPLILECSQYKGKIVSIVNILTKNNFPIIVKTI